MKDIKIESTLTVYDDYNELPAAIAALMDKASKARLQGSAPKVKASEARGTAAETGAGKSAGIAGGAKAA